VIADLHSHYPMHIVPGAPRDALRAFVTARGRGRLRDRARALAVGLASRFGNYRSFESGPRVTIPLLRQGGVGVALSVLYSPFDELDVEERYGAPPRDDYFANLLRQLKTVEREVADKHRGEARIARTPAELDEALAAGEVALVHCVEGGFHLGGEPEVVERNVGELARHGVAYITLAHLFWRRVAADENAIPFLPDALYDRLFPQPPVGLTELGRAAVRAMVAEHVLIDLSHMNERALADTFALLDELDPSRDVPVIASHSPYRFGRQDYNLTAATIERIAERGGVVGLILAEHQAGDGLRRSPTKSLDDSLALLFRHLDRLREITGSHAHSGIGSDLDGFIKPTLAGLDHAGQLADLERALVNRYGPEDAESISSGNVLRLLRRQH
jgi:microsomal dipeptidase-like Zn-dependent dipeptidase